MENLSPELLSGIPEVSEINQIYCYSGYFIDKTQEELSEWLAGEFNKSSDIKSLKKKKSIQTILNKIKDIVEKLRLDKYSFQFFVNNNDDYFFRLSRDQVQTLKKYIGKDSRIKKEDTFCLEYWKDIYFNNEFANVYRLEKNEKFTHYSFTDTKFEQKDSFPSDLFGENNQKFRVTFFIQTKDNKKNKIMEKLIQLAPFIELEKGDSIHHQLKFTLKQLEYRKQIDILSKQWKEIELKPDFYVFGNDILKAIQNYEIKEVYCYREFKTKIEKNMSKDALNFKWYVFENNKNEDNSDLLKLGDYKGIFAKKYYV